MGLTLKGNSSAKKFQIFVDTDADVCLARRCKSNGSLLGFEYYLLKIRIRQWRATSSTVGESMFLYSTEFLHYMW